MLQGSMSTFKWSLSSFCINLANSSIRPVLPPMQTNYKKQNDGWLASAQWFINNLQSMYMYLEMPLAEPPSVWEWVWPTSSPHTPHIAHPQHPVSNIHRQWHTTDYRRTDVTHTCLCTIFSCVIIVLIWYKTCINWYQWFKRVFIAWLSVIHNSSSHSAYRFLSVLSSNTPRG